MSSATDVLRAKTDAELQFFIANPSHYHADLVASARQELRRRGVAPAAAVATSPSYAATYEEEEDLAPSKRPLLLGAAVLLLGLATAGIWQAQRPAAAPLAVSRPGKLSPDSLRLETVEARPLPNFDTEKISTSQLARIPAAEKQEAQALRQFKGLSRRFWAAETQTEYLTNQAYAGKAGPMFAEQTLVARETWRAWNKAAVYGYRFGPTMQDHYQRMAKVASSQQHILSNLPGLLPERKFLTDKELQARDAETQDWLAGLQPTSPVTGKAYRVTVLQMKM